MLKKQVLVNGISNLSDARYCAGMMVDFLSFELNENHPDFIPCEKIKEIRDWLSGPKIGGRVSEWPTDYPWEDLKPDFLIITSSDLLSKASDITDKIFLETKEATTEEGVGAFIISDINNADDPEIAYFIELGDSNLSVEDVLENDLIHGVSLRGQKETRPGFSQYDELMDVLEALEEDY
ncbi:hypothetical protein [Jiulongibacter sp. NS-SX5]|uniref:hypothetical protein n=1 Tax=Jiulongibacter sp. NS-SX5 TaxID=3463854 RepID=UPI0040584009